MATLPNHTPTSDLVLANLPKEHSRGPPTPPPAYFPRVPTMPPAIIAASLAAAARHQQQQATAAANNSHALAADRQAMSAAPPDDVDSTSAITVRISTAVRVSGRNNTVHIAVSPAATARLVAQAVTRVIRGGGAAERGGIPMIDEEGRPRPLRIEIEAGVEVRGSGNVVGGVEGVVRAAGKRGREMEEEGEAGEGDRRVRRRRCVSV